LKRWMQIIRKIKVILHNGPCAQGCQIFHRTTYQNGKKYSKWPQNMPNDHKICQMATKYAKWPQNTYTKWPQNTYTKWP
jgi:hypothetical protein